MPHSCKTRVDISTGSDIIDWLVFKTNQKLSFWICDERSPDEDDKTLNDVLKKNLNVGDLFSITVTLN